jgi:hypothetical protein
MTAAELNPHHGDGSVFSTARSATGGAAREITSDTRITIAGVQGTVAFFEREGLIHHDGTAYREGAAPGSQVQAEAAPQVDERDFPGMPQEVAARIDQALDGVADAYLDPLIASGIGSATGEIDRAVMVRQMSSFAGVSPDEAASRVADMEAGYRQQADSVLTGTFGMTSEDIADFVGFCKTYHKGAFRDAITKQIRESDVSGIRNLGELYYRATAPSLNAVKAAGLQTRQLGEKPEVLLDGRWLPIASAARLGMI